MDEISATALGNLTAELSKAKITSETEMWKKLQDIASDHQVTKRDDGSIVINYNDHIVTISPEAVATLSDGTTIPSTGITITPMPQAGLRTTG
jgi:hypothetical protein